MQTRLWLRARTPRLPKPSFRQATSQRPDPMALPVLLRWFLKPSGPLGGCVSAVYSAFEGTAGLYSPPCSSVRPGKQADLGDGTLASLGAT